MKIGCLQFAPSLGTVQDNIYTAESILQSSTIPSDLDWLVLPELAFSGYNFQSLDEIRPYLEPTTSGISTQWAIKVARQLGCHVTVGYPETTAVGPQRQYNSTVTVDPTGEVVHNYRKSFLYYTDETWATEGPLSETHVLANSKSPDGPFFSGPLSTLGRVTLGICMDINPYRFTAAWDAYEFARTAVTNKTPVICVSMAWLSYLTPAELVQEPSKPDIATVAYWMERFQPVTDSSSDKPVYIILANRCGVERGVCYAGSSTVAKIEKGAVTILSTAGRNEEKLLLVDLTEISKCQVRNGS